MINQVLGQRAIQIVESLGNRFQYIEIPAFEKRIFTLPKTHSKTVDVLFLDIRLEADPWLSTVWIPALFFVILSGNPNISKEGFPFVKAGWTPFESEGQGAGSSFLSFLAEIISFLFLIKKNLYIFVLPLHYDRL